MVKTPNYDLDIDSTLGGNNASDYIIPSQKAIKEYVDNNSGGSPAWGNIRGTLSDQTDLQNALNAKANDSAVVKLTGNQTITGTKAFSSAVQFANNTLNNIGDDVKVGDGNVGGCLVIQGTNNATGIQLRPQEGTTGNNRKIYLNNDYISLDVTPATSDNSTKIATTAYVVNVLKAVYPVGAVYIGTTSTCPLASFFGTWTLKSTGIVTSVDSNVPVKGNGKALGLTDGSTDYSLGNDTGTANGRHTCLYKIFSNSSLPATSSNATISTNNALFGVNTDDTKSGIVGTVTRSTLSVNIWERTA